MSVYFIRAGNFVKIGMSKFPEKRLSKMQSDNPEQLSIIRTVDGGCDIERGFHRQFETYWVRGEWYLFNKLMLSALPVSVPVEVVPVDPNRARRGSPEHLAKIGAGVRSGRMALRKSQAQAYRKAGMQVPECLLDTARVFFRREMNPGIYLVLADEQVAA